jgi:sn-glycerol 3-phosphate transport system substrate-binding protein
LEGVELGVGPFPFVAGGDGKPGVGSRGLWIMNKRSEEEQRAAWTFSKWLAEPEQQAEFFAGSGYLPVRISAYDLDASKQVLAKYPQYQAPIDEFVGAPATPAKLGALLGPFNQVREIMAQALEEMLLGGKDPAGLDDAAARITEEFRVQRAGGGVGTARQEGQPDTRLSSRAERLHNDRC